jgi:hypothetical protein
MNILDAVADPKLFAPWFRDAGTWRAWHAFLAALFALPMSDEQLALYREHTGRTEPPAAPFNEGWLICGRRAGKSAVLAICAAYLGCFRDYRPYLAPGERATIRIMARDRDQARTIFRYLSALLSEIPLLKRMVVKELAESFELSNRVIIEVGSASFRSTRGYTYAAILADELAIWTSDESSNPDIEILRATAGHADDPGRRAALRQFALRAPWCVVGDVSAIVRQRRPAGAGVEGADHGDESDGATG